METVKKHQCVVLVGETGSGKTTQVINSLMIPLHRLCCCTYMIACAYLYCLYIIFLSMYMQVPGDGVVLLTIVDNTLYRCTQVAHSVTVALIMYVHVQCRYILLISACIVL